MHIKSAAPADPSGRTIFYTRLGIGVFDPKWWDYRLRLFAAVTLPSVGRFCSPDVQWVIFIDEDMDQSTLSKVEGLVISAGLESSVTFVPLQFHFDAFDVLARLASSRAEGDGNIGLVRIDDDDALSADFIARCFGLLLKQDSAPALITLPAGWEVSLADRKMRPITLEFGSMNTFYFGPVALVQSFAAVGHHRLGAWAPKHGLQVIVDTDPRPAFMYMRHKQSDTSFGAHRSSILGDEAARFMTQATYAQFGIDQENLNVWRDYARTAPSTGANKTWEVAASVVADASRIKKELNSKKDTLRKLGSDVFR